ncbi:MAG: hypothetical protein O0X96_05590 [Methanocorpusculum sp.]|nr:hypothetical protein [Methanocorpusculum sp.]
MSNLKLDCIRLCPDDAVAKNYLFLHRFDFEINRRNQLRIRYITLIGIFSFLVTFSYETIISWVKKIIELSADGTYPPILAISMMVCFLVIPITYTGIFQSYLRRLYRNLYYNDVYEYPAEVLSTEERVNKVANMAELNGFLEKYMRNFTRMVVVFTVMWVVEISVLKLVTSMM